MRSYAWGGNLYKLHDAYAPYGLPFYGDNENPHTWTLSCTNAQDDWREVLRRYVRKGEIPGMLEAVAGAYMLQPRRKRYSAAASASNNF